MVASAAVMAALGPRSPGEGRRLATAALAALLLESALIAAVVWWIAAGLHPVVRPKGLSRIELSLTVPAPVVAHPLPKPRPPYPRPVAHPLPKPPPVPHVHVHPHPKPVPKPKAKPTRRHHRLVHHRRPVHPVARPQPVATHPVPKAAAIPKPSTPPRRAPAGNPSALAAWEDHVKAAIQDALVYPSSARWLGESGRVRVSFEWTEGVVLHPQVLVSSGIPALDRAALMAVRDATIPPPPGDIGSRPFRFAIWVRFSLAGDS